MFVKQGCPRQLQSQNMAKISKSYILTPYIVDESLSIVCWRDRITDRQTDRQTIQLIYAAGVPFRTEAKK